MRTPRNIGAKPSDQTIDRPSTTSLTFSLNVRVGAALATSSTVPPSRVSPSMRVSVEFHSRWRAGSTSWPQTAAGGAAMSTVTATAMRKVVREWVEAALD